MAVKLYGFGWNSNDKHVPWKMFCKAAFFVSVYNEYKAK